jgi:hypothetical protein
MSLYYAYVKGKPTVSICDEHFSPFVYHYSWIIVKDEDESIEMMRIFIPSEGLRLSHPTNRPSDLGWGPKDLLTLVRDDCADMERTVLDTLALQGEVLRDFYIELSAVREHQRNWEGEFRILLQIYAKHRLPITRLTSLNQKGRHEDEFTRRTLEEQLAESRQLLEDSLEREKGLKEQIYKLRQRLDTTPSKEAPEPESRSRADTRRNRGYRSIYLVSAFEEDQQKVRSWLGDDEFPLEAEKVRYEDHEAWIRRLHDRGKLADLVIYSSDKMRHMQDSKSVLEKKCDRLVSVRTISQAIERLTQIGDGTEGEGEINSA